MTVAGRSYRRHGSRGRSGILLLDVKSWPSNTRLYKAVDAHGLAVDCSVPAGAKLTRWLSDWAKQTHKSQLSPARRICLIEMVGPELGLLDQELAKLALMAGSDKKITPEMVQKMGGGWRAKTTWAMLDLALDGNVTEALQQIDRLLASGEAPVGLLGRFPPRSAAWPRPRAWFSSPRRPVAASAWPRLAAGGRQQVLSGKDRAQLKRLGRHRGSQLYRWLLQADLDLKGDSQMPPRLILERLIVRLAAPA